MGLFDASGLDPLGVFVCLVTVVMGSYIASEFRRLESLVWVMLRGRGLHSTKCSCPHSTSLCVCVPLSGLAVTYVDQVSCSCSRFNPWLAFSTLRHIRRQSRRRTDQSSPHLCFTPA
jgi:hypothetical protein